jgi:uncharacterized protein (DUF1800 family)
MRIPDSDAEHLLRRAGFGARPDEDWLYTRMSREATVDLLLNYEWAPDDVDSKIGTPGFVGVTTRNGPFLPNSAIVDARQRWLFRMVHSMRPLQEKMTLFWHHHFATGYAKIAGIVGQAEATRYMAGKASEDPANVQGQIEMLREHALGNFEDLLVRIAKDTAMLFWLDGRQNTRTNPQENFAREIMELFTMGVGTFTEADVYAAARVFTGWNLTRPGQAADGTQHYEFFYNANQHDTAAKTFTFPIYTDGGRTIPARAASAGMQDGLDFIAALARNELTGRRLAGKLYRFFVSETGEISQSFVNRVAGKYQSSRYDMKQVMREVLLSPEFWDTSARFARYAWPVEFVVRSLKDIGWNGFSVNDAITPLSNMGQILFDPPDVNGWDTGQAWFSTGSMLARMNFASALSLNQKFKLAEAAAGHTSSPDALLTFVLDSIPTAPLSSAVTSELNAYLTSTGPWTGSTTQVQSKVAGLAHLVAGSPEYQLV